ncbi:kinase-like domain-containing protein [Rhizophagus clarus]|uniref:Kinase-like domain-containing protein n=2 Tax=Rhizophagus clarus TaxID=94130 RepID=A0A8H3LS18_9GLOM|nr:kinase-like domain-containing protein [Rhizophagus clarus]
MKRLRTGVRYLIIQLDCTFIFGKSENEIMDKFISDKKLRWIPYNKFENVKYLNKGGFGTVDKAIWLDETENREVALKCLNKMNENLDEFLNEWKYHESCSDSLEIISLYGVTKNPHTLKYMVVMDYANEGNLRGNLSRIIKYNWSQKLHMLREIISGLNEIHKQDLIHCDFHDGNILIHKIQTNEGVENYKAFISDLGLCQSVKSSRNDDIFGVLPFIAPEVLRGNSHTQASDIYSFSMIMWEFTSGVSPFNDKEHDLQLSLSICKGERPEIIENTPECYVGLMTKCWSEDPLKRPSSEEILNIIEKWIILPKGKRIKNINEELKSNIIEFKNAPIGRSKPITETHPKACYTSRLLDFNSRELSECLSCMINDDVKQLDIKADEN